MSYTSAKEKISKTKQKKRTDHWKLYFIEKTITEPYSAWENITESMIGKSDQWFKMSWGRLITQWKNTIGHRNGVLMWKVLLLLKISMEGVWLKLVNDILRTLQNSDFISGCQGFYGALHVLKYQIDNLKWNLNFEMS